MTLFLCVIPVAGFELSSNTAAIPAMCAAEVQQEKGAEETRAKKGGKIKKKGKKDSKWSRKQSWPGIQCFLVWYVTLKLYTHWAFYALS